LQMERRIILPIAAGQKSYALKLCLEPCTDAPDYVP
jgi:hypothetical protein